MALTDVTVRNAKPREKSFKLSDEKGLPASRAWRLEVVAAEISLPRKGKEAGAAAGGIKVLIPENSPPASYEL
jgi:hypothetical protein